MTIAAPASPSTWALTCLLITARSRKRYQNRGQSDICEFGDGSGAGSSDDEVGAA